MTDTCQSQDHLLNLRVNLYNIIDLNKNILEIGASHAPLMDHSKENVYNIDVLTKEELIDKNKKENWGSFDDNRVPNTDFLLSADNDFDFYKCIGDTIKFDYIVSSHNFEHFPDLIKTLNSLEKILTDNGRIIAFMPDCRFEFDKFRNVTKVSKLLSDFYLKKSKPSLEEILENRLYYCDKSTHSLWDQYNTCKNMSSLDTDVYLKKEEHQLLHSQIDKGNNKDELDFIYKQFLTENYIDAHVNCFTPDSFKTNLEILLKLKYIHLTIDSLQYTHENSHEFSVILKKQ
jgi:hypothetical protein